MSVKGTVDVMDCRLVSSDRTVRFSLGGLELCGMVSGEWWLVADAAAQYTGQSDTAGSAGADGYAVLGRAEVHLPPLAPATGGGELSKTRRGDGTRSHASLHNSKHKTLEEATRLFIFKRSWHFFYLFFLFFIFC